MANTLNAHRVIQHFQEKNGPEVADKIVECKQLGSALNPSFFALITPSRHSSSVASRGLELTAGRPANFS